jgi:major membrane immunogen (membrane-anchored lipoprotein)
VHTASAEKEALLHIPHFAGEPTAATDMLLCSQMIEDGYAAKVAAEKKETQAKMKAEEAHMIKRMEDQRAAEEKAIHDFRMQEERRETVVLAQKKTYDIKQAEAKIRADEAKKVKVLEAKLSALHNCELSVCTYAKLPPFPPPPPSPPLKNSPLGSI